MVAKTSSLVLSNGDTAYFPVGFLHNYASIPWYLRYRLESQGPYRDSFICHDWLYGYGGYFTDKKLTKFISTTRRFADREMWWQMRQMGATVEEADLYYKGVKYFGWKSYLK